MSLTRLTESRLSGCGQSANLTVVAFDTDGVFLTPPPVAARRIEFIGDSISAGDLNDASFLRPATTCGNAMWNDDILYSMGGLLCAPGAPDNETLSLGADCMFTAWGGITLDGMQRLYPFTFSASGADAYRPWSFDAFLPHAVVINLGTNDQPKPPARDWQAEYVRFASDIARVHYARAPPVLFLGYGPMTRE